MASRGALLDKIRTQFFLSHEHNYDWDSLDEMTPFMFELQVVLVMEHLKKLKELKKASRLG